MIRIAIVVKDEKQIKETVDLYFDLLGENVKQVRKLRDEATIWTGTHQIDIMMPKHNNRRKRYNYLFNTTDNDRLIYYFLAPTIRPYRDENYWTDKHS